MKKTSNQNKIFLTVGIIMALSEIWKQYSLTFRVYGGYFSLWYIPFQLCSIPMYLSLIIPFVRRENIRAAMICFIASFGLLGGICAFFDTSGMQYTLPALTAHSYIWHIALILLGLYAGLIARPKGRAFPGAIIIYLICCAIAEIFNISLYKYEEINMFYISPKYGTAQVIFSDISRLLGNNVRIAVYMGCSILGSFILYKVLGRLYNILEFSNKD